MSLTSQLDNSSSPIRKFLEERSPNTRAVTSEANAQFRKVETIRPSEPVPWGTMGTAFDYRARYYFQAWIWLGWTSNRLASSAMVCSPWSPAKATFFPSYFRSGTLS